MALIRRWCKREAPRTVWPGRESQEQHDGNYLTLMYRCVKG
jgi:hypothetical protein